MKLVIGLDIGTSGIRAQAIETETKQTLSTSITLRHPLPGSNVMDHLDFCINNGLEVGHKIVIRAVEEVLRSLDIDLNSTERVAVCGNPIQLSIFQGIEIRDLAYAGDNALQRLGISRLDRRAKISLAGELGISVLKSDVEVCIPPAVAHMIGADAIAMIYEARILDKRECAIVTDYGTNAEMALISGDEIYTGSAAAGPAIEGQQIEKGMLASPGAISDLNFVDGQFRITVLDDLMIGNESYFTDGIKGMVTKLRTFVPPIGITGTGVIALVYSGIISGLIKLPRIDTPTRTIKLYR
ncbi:MAG: ASKHA domain-containing protein, partial [Candidatus Methanosuratincola petrocarbonis]